MAAVDYFLQIDGIKGESTDAKHKDEIEVYSWSWGASQMAGRATGAGGGAGKVTISDVSFTAGTSKASPELFLTCAEGRHIKKAMLFCRKAGKDQQEYLKVTLSDILVSNYSQSGSQQNVLPMDQVTLNFSKIEFEYLPQKADGTLDAKVVKGWDLKKNVKV